MKAAIVFSKGDQPRYVEDVPAPVASQQHDVLVSVKAVAIKHLDKMRASGKHYSTQQENWQPKIVGGDGVGITASGRRIYGIGISGTMAEKALFDNRRIVAVPDGLDDTIAAALPNAIMGSAMAMLFRAGIKSGDTVLINGATGFTGKIAVQLARHYGAARIIATGRNEQVLQELKSLGADELVSLQQDESVIIKQLQALHKRKPIDIVLDYIWGVSAELILEAIKGDGGFSPCTRYITIGAMSGDKIQLSSSILRSTDLHLAGSGLGSWKERELDHLFAVVLPEAFQLALAGKLKADIVCMGMANIEKAWETEISGGQRLVVVI